MKRGFKINMATNHDTERIEAELSLYGVIAEDSFFGGDIVPSEVVEALSELQADSLTLLINSPGGDPFGGFAIKNRIEKLVADGQIKEVHAVGEGLVASAATLPFLAGKTRVMRQGSRFMIHEARGMGVGKADDLRSYADELERTNAEANEYYAAKSNHTETEISEMMAAETWLSPAESVQAGFATSRSDAFAVAACATRQTLIDLLHFEAVPEDLETTEKEIEPDPREAALKSLVFAE